MLHFKSLLQQTYENLFESKNPCNFGNNLLFDMAKVEQHENPLLLKLIYLETSCTEAMESFRFFVSICMVFPDIRIKSMIIIKKRSKAIMTPRQIMTIFSGSISIFSLERILKRSIYTP